MKKKNERSKQLLTLAALFIFMWPLPAHSQSADAPSLSDPVDESVILFQEIPSVFGASKYEQKVTEAPSSVSIVTADEIKKYGYRTLADILGSIRGFYTTYDRNYHYLGVRGFNRPGDYNSRILLLADGHRINDYIYDMAPIGTDFPIDVDLIDRVEVIRGPSSSLYGASAFFGVINVITKSGRDLKESEVSGEAASHETYKGRFSYGNRFQNGFEMLLSGSIYDSEGDDWYYKEFDDPTTNYGQAEGVDDDQYHSFFLKASFNDFAFQGVYSSREKGIPTSPWEIEFNNPQNRTTDDYIYLDLKYEHSFSNQLDVLARIYYDRYEYDGDYLWDWADPGDPPFLVLNKDFAYGKTLGTELQFRKRLFETHKFVLGGEYRDNFRQDQGTYDEDPFWEYIDDKRDSNNWAVYLQDEFQILENLIFNAGVRYDHYDNFGGTTNPRLALIYNPVEKTTLKLLYGEAFRAPNFYELFYHDGPDVQKNNPDLDPETINTYELVLEQYLGNHLRGVATGFYYKIEDLITQQIDPADDLLVFNNVEEIEAKGIELELEGKWASGLTGRISYTYQETEDQNTGKILTNSPKHLAKFNLIVPLFEEKIFANAEVQYTGERKTLADREADDFFVTNLTLFSQNLLQGLEASVSVYNLFDKEYDDPGFGEHLQDVIEQDGRIFRFKLTYAF
jgi:iron complex outermembrane receptor protein